MLDGSVRQDGDRVRIVGRLIDSRTGEQIWSEAFQRDIKDLFIMQSEVTRRIAVAIKGELGEADATLLSAARSRDTEAFKLYMKGRYYWSARTEEALTRSVQLYNEAIARDSQFAAAFAGLADSFTALGLYGSLPRAEAFANAAAAANRAIELIHRSPRRTLRSAIRRRRD